MTIQRLTMMLALLLATAGSATAQVMLERAVISNGGGRATGSTTLDYTIGQPVVGRAGNGTINGEFGFWFSSAVSGPSSVDIEAGAGAVMAAKLSPNPASERVTLTLLLARQGALDILLYDVNGRAVSTLYSGDGPSGTFDLPIDLAGIPSGTYYVAIGVPGALLQRPLTVVR